MPIEVIEKAFAVVEVMARLGRSAPLAELTAETRLPKPTLHRILRTLADLGYVESHGRRGEYALTERLLSLGRSDRHRELREKSLPLMEHLHQLFGETVNLAVLEGLYVYYVDVLETSHALRWIVRPGTRDPFHTTALGRAVAAALPSEKRTALVAKVDLKHPANRPVHGRAQLTELLETTRLRGWAAEDEETVAGVACFAFSLARWGEVLAAISVSVPVSRLNSERRHRIAEAIGQILRDAPTGQAQLARVS